MFPGSDVEDDDDDIVQAEGQPANYIMSYRGLQDGVVLKFSVTPAPLGGHDIPVSGGQYVYEAILLLWLHAWFDARTTADATPFIPVFDSKMKTGGDLFGFFSHMDILLPLCLKSLVLRHGDEVQQSLGISEKVLLDKEHMKILELFMEMISSCLMGEAMATPEDRDKALLRALTSSEIVIEFLQGLFAILHQEQIHCLIKTYFRTLRNCETEHLKENNNGMIEFEWTQETIHRVKSSRQLRLRAVEMLAVLPSFLALNFPLKYSDRAANLSSSGMKSTWKMQYSEADQERASDNWPTLPRDGKLPESGWLAKILVDEGLWICGLSCEAVGR